jgi:hypothetical protein
VALVALPAATIFVLGYMRRHVTDDALIYGRTVRQILAGNGPVLNVGERAEASTSSLWQWLLALAGWATRINVEQLAVFGGLLLTTAGSCGCLGGNSALSAGETRTELYFNSRGYPSPPCLAASVGLCNDWSGIRAADFLARKLLVVVGAQPLNGQTAVRHS